MKKTQKKFSLRLVLVLAAVLALSLAIVLVGCGKKEDAPAADDGNHVQLYWNVDRWEYVAGNTDGTSGRYPRGDGFYYVRLAAGGEQKDYQVEDYAVINKMDLIDMFMPVFDERGVIVDIKTVNECTGGFLAPKLYVKSVEGNTIHANTQGTFLGMDMDFVIDEETEVYDVGGGSILAGIIGQIEADDELVVIKDKDGTIGTVYVFGYTPVGDIYWNLHRMYDSTSKTTTRDPDALGYYNFELALNGEVVNLRTRDYKLANNIDAQGAKCFALTFDENGDIKTRESTSYAGISATFGSWYHVTDIHGDKVTAERIAAGADMGTVVEGVMSKDCKVLDVSEYGGYSGKITELRVGDQIHGLRDKRGRIAYIFVHNRPATEEDGYKLFYNLERKYNSTTKETTRYPDAKGWYYAKVLQDGKEMTVKTQDKAVMSALDAITQNILSLKVDENGVIEDLKHGYGIFGGTSVGAYYYIDTLDGYNFTAHHDYGSTMSGAITADTIIYNVSDGIKSHKGERTELQVGDRFIGIGDLRKNIRVMFVIKRPVDVPLYWNLTRNYNSTTKQTTKKPDANGFYWYTFASEGKQVKLKVRTKEMANKIDSNAALCHGFYTNGDEVTKVIGAGSVKGLNGGTRSVSWVDITYIDGQYLVAQKNQKGHAQDGKLFEVVLANSCKIYDVSTGYVEYQGEKTTLRVGDKIAAYHNGDGLAMYVWVVGGRSKPINPNRYDCPCAQGVTWEPWDGTTPLESGKSYYLTNDVVAPTEGFYLEATAVNLRLDGHTISSSGRCFYLHNGGQLNICDHGTRGKLVGSGVSGESGGVVRVYTASGGAQFNAWNIDMEYKDAGHPAKEGGIISAAGPVSLYDVNLKNGVSAGKGGNVTVSIYGNFRMFGGSAVNGNANTIGGNINVEGIGYLEGVTISGGKATGNGKDVYFSGESYAKRLKDITLGSGVAGLYLSSCKVEVDGTLNTGMTLAGSTTLTNIGLSKDSKITLKKGSEGTVLSGAATDMTGIFTNSDTSGDYVLEYDSKAKEVVMVSTIVPSNHETSHCMCNGVANGVADHNCDDIGDWIAITDDVFETAYGTSGENRGIKFKKSGNYYLTVPYTLKSGLCIMPDQEITICLNGYRLTGSNQAGRVAGTLNITDCLGGGKVTSLVDATNGNTIKVLAGGEFNFFGGTLTAESSNTDGGVIAVTMDKGGIAPATSTEPGVMNMYGGTVTGGVAKNGGNIIVWHSSIFNMYGGVIEKGSSQSDGDNLRATSSSVVVNLLGGVIRNGNTCLTNCSVTLGGDIQIEELIVGGKPASVGSMGLDDTAKIGMAVSAAGTLVTNVSAADFGKFTFTTTDSNISVSHEAATRSIVAKFTSTHKHCVCGGVDPVGHSCASVDWMPLNAATIGSYFSVSSSRYVANSSKLYLYLTEDLDLTYSINLNDGQYIALCLNGFDLKHTKTANPVMRVWGDLDITDCSADRDGQIIGYRTGESPCLYIQNWVSGTQYVTPTVNLFAGTLTAKDGSTSSKAGVMQIGNKVSPDGDNWATFNMYGGKICGGHGMNGGNVYLETSKTIFNMYGGEITGGTAQASGGGIYVTGSAQLNILGGKITGNTKGTGFGADIYTPSVTNVTLGGKITIGEYYSNTIVLKLQDLDATSSIGILRNADASALFATGATTDVSKCFVNAKLTAVWNSADKTLSFVEGGSTEPELPPVTTDHNHCICGDVKPDGHSCSDVGFVKLTQADFTNATEDSAPVRINGTNFELAAGSYYLGEDITVNKSIITVEGATVNLCLNGKTLTGDKVRTFFLKAKVTFTDCGESGTVTSNSGLHGPAMYARTGATVTVYGCTFLGSKLDSSALTGGGTIVVGGTLTTYNTTIKGGDASAVKKNGGNIAIADGGTFKMYGGEISGGKVGDSQSGGNIRLDSGSFYLYDGTVKGGYANEGGNIAIGSSGKVYVSGGVVEGGQAVSHGGNIATFGLLEVSGGVIRGGVAGVNGKTDVTGGNITTFANKSVVTITGGLIENGVAPLGANVALRTSGSTKVSMTMTGGEIKGGDLKSVLVNNFAAITITVGGDAKIDSIYLNGANRRVTISTSKPLTAVAAIGITAVGAQTVVDGRTDLSGFTSSDSAKYELVEEGGNLVLKEK